MAANESSDLAPHARSRSGLRAALAVCAAATTALTLAGCTSGDGVTGQRATALAEAQSVCRSWGFGQDAHLPGPDPTVPVHVDTAAAEASATANKASHAENLDTAWTPLAAASHTMAVIVQGEVTFEYLPPDLQSDFRDAYFTAAEECRKAYAAG
ncbi:hypothetical protein PV341_30965 [Streptomyces sp. PA03-1a]|nr:hypothetical protein [Streptomyces sp. PA03-1a]